MRVVLDTNVYIGAALQGELIMDILEEIVNNPEITLISSEEILLGLELAKEYEILTAEIAKATFGVTPSEHKKIKGLKRENLRDNMNDLELLFSQLSEAATTEITKTEHPRGFVENKSVSRRGGKIAGDARSNLEKETGRKVITSQNYLPKRQSKKLLK